LCRKAKIILSVSYILNIFWSLCLKLNMLYI
jgi:hypothetical protein